MFRGSLPEDNSITLSFRPWPEPLSVRANTDRLRQILLNMLANALDAVSGGGTITVRTEPGPEMVWVRVEDTGPGIDPALQAGLFEDGVSGKEGRHGGFGLAIVRSLSGVMGGTEACDSRPGGTVFATTLQVIESLVKKDEQLYSLDIARQTGLNIVRWTLVPRSTRCGRQRPVGLTVSP